MKQKLTIANDSYGYVSNERIFATKYNNQKRMQEVENNPFTKLIFRYSILKRNKQTPNLRTMVSL